MRKCVKKKYHIKLFATWTSQMGNLAIIITKTHICHRNRQITIPDTTCKMTWNASSKQRKQLFGELHMYWSPSHKKLTFNSSIASFVCCMSHSDSSLSHEEHADSVTDNDMTSSFDFNNCSSLYSFFPSAIRLCSNVLWTHNRWMELEVEGHIQWPPGSVTLNPVLNLTPAIGTLFDADFDQLLYLERKKFMSLSQLLFRGLSLCSLHTQSQCRVESNNSSTTTTSKSEKCCSAHPYLTSLKKS